MPYEGWEGDHFHLWTFFLAVASSSTAPSTLHWHASCFHGVQGTTVPFGHGRRIVYRSTSTRPFHATVVPSMGHDDIWRLVRPFGVEAR